MSPKQKILIVLGIAVCLLVAGALYALAQTDGVIKACVAKEGMLRIVTDASQCRKNETLLTWSIQGAQGEKGDKGDPGPTGPTGPTGGAGLSCPSGKYLSGIATDSSLVCVALPVCGNLVVEPPETCDDGNFVNNDGCTFFCRDETGGCGAMNCGDSNACTLDQCTVDEGQPACHHDALLVCDDADVCTTNSCDPATGCVFAPVNCDDGDPSTTDACVPEAGCIHISPPPPPP